MVYILEYNTNTTKQLIITLNHMGIMPIVYFSGVGGRVAKYNLYQMRIENNVDI